MVIDAYHYLNIKVYKSNDSLLHESNLWDNKFWGQPFIDRYKANNDTIISADNSVYNLDINFALLSILPKKSLLRDTFKIDKFLNCYIAWYADKVYNEKY